MSSKRLKLNKFGTANSSPDTAWLVSPRFELIRSDLIHIHASFRCREIKSLTFMRLLRVAMPIQNNSEYKTLTTERLRVYKRASKWPHKNMDIYTYIYARGYTYIIIYIYII